MYLNVNVTCCGRGGNLNEHFDGQVSLLETLCLHICYIEWHYYLIVIVYHSLCPSFICLHAYNYIVMHVLELFICVNIYTWVLTVEGL